MKLAIKSGAIIPVLLMLPNLAWMLLYSLDAGAKSGVLVALSAAENVARSVAMVLPFFCSTVAVLLLASYLMNSWWLFSAAVAFGVSHVWALTLTSL